MAQEHTHQVEAMVQRAALVPDGYAMAIHVATTIAVQSWQARVIMPQQAQVDPGPGTAWGDNIASGAPQTIRPGGHATAWLGITNTQDAPHYVQVTATDHHGNEHPAPVAQVMVTDPHTGQPRTSTEQDWPGSTRMGGQETGSGGGGGGGGGGQYTCDLYVDMERRIVTHRITSDAGGGGGSGGGSAQGEYSDHYRESP